VASGGLGGPVKKRGAVPEKVGLGVQGGVHLRVLKKEPVEAVQLEKTPPEPRGDEKACAKGGDKPGKRNTAKENLGGKGRDRPQGGKWGGNRREKNGVRRIHTQNKNRTQNRPKPKTDGRKAGQRKDPTKGQSRTPRGKGRVTREWGQRLRARAVTKSRDRSQERTLLEKKRRGDGGMLKRREKKKTARG